MCIPKPMECKIKQTFIYFCEYTYFLEYLGICIASHTAFSSLCCLRFESLNWRILTPNPCRGEVSGYRIPVSAAECCQMTEEAAFSGLIQWSLWGEHNTKYTEALRYAVEMIDSCLPWLLISNLLNQYLAAFLCIGNLYFVVSPAKLRWKWTIFGQSWILVKFRRANMSTSLTNAHPHKVELWFVYKVVNGDKSRPVWTKTLFHEGH